MRLYEALVVEKDELKAKLHKAGEQNYELETALGNTRNEVASLRASRRELEDKLSSSDLEVESLKRTVLRDAGIETLNLVDAHHARIAEIKAEYGRRVDDAKAEKERETRLYIDTLSARDGEISENRRNLHAQYRASPYDGGRSAS